MLYIYIYCIWSFSVEKRLKAYCFCLDARMVYDASWRNGLWKKMWEIKDQRKNMGNGEKGDGICGSAMMLCDKNFQIRWCFTKSDTSMHPTTHFFQGVFERHDRRSRGSKTRSQGGERYRIGIYVREQFRGNIRNTRRTAETNGDDDKMHWGMENDSERENKRDGIISQK